MSTPLEPSATGWKHDAVASASHLVESLLRWEDAPQDPRAIQDALDDLKRVADALAWGDDADLAQAVELGRQALVAIQQGQTRVPAESIEALLELAQCLVAFVQSPESGGQASARPVVERLRAICSPSPQQTGVPADAPILPPRTTAAPDWPPPAQDLAPELVASFKAESYENLAQVEQALLVLEKSPQDQAALSEAFRGIHNIKGAARYVGLNQLGALAHGIEDVLDQVRAGRRTWEASMADLVLRAVDELRQMTDALRGGEEQPRDLSGLLAELRETARERPEAPGEAGPAESHASARDAALHAAEQQLEAIAGCAERLLSGNATDNVLATLARAACTLKAASRALGDCDLTEAAHRVYEPTRRTASNRPALREQATAIADEVARTATLRVLQGDASDAALDSLMQIRPELYEAINRFRNERADCAARWNQKRHPPAAPARATLPTAQERGCPVGLREGTANLPASAPGPGTAKPASANRPRHEDVAGRSIRVDQRKLDEYINLAGELVIARNALAHEFRQAGLNPAHHRRLKESIDRVDRIVADIQANAMLMRMVPVATLFQRFPRMVRDIARSLDKQIELHTVGEETELDKQLAERLADPLVHLVRNAADHGIEPPHVRRAAGKPETGSITLCAGRQGGTIVLEIADDGAGIPAERLKAKAVERGLITPARAAAMSYQEALQLVFAPGLSTASAVSDLSGRGVGMDVVRNNLAGLGGTVTVHSEPGQGTRFRLELPLTLAVTNALLAAVDDTVYAVPVDSVREILRMTPGQFRRLNRQWVIPLRGQIVPVKPLRDLLGNGQQETLAPTAEPNRISTRGTHHAEKLDDRPVLVVRRSGSHYGLLVDRLLGQQEIVIKPLPGHLGKFPGLSGAAILGDGQVALILEPARLAL